MARRTEIPPGEVITIAMAGNPNVGKSTLFNYLTGSNQHVGNFPGVTVQKKEGTILAVPDAGVIDLRFFIFIRIIFLSCSFFSSVLYFLVASSNWKST